MYKLNKKSNEGLLLPLKRGEIIYNLIIKGKDKALGQLVSAYATVPHIPAMADAVSMNHRVPWHRLYKGYEAVITHHGRNLFHYHLEVLPAFLLGQ